jgi:hypothetical protein
VHAQEVPDEIEEILDPFRDWAGDGLRHGVERRGGQGCFDHLQLTKETTRLSPGAAENKYYKAGVGFIFGVIVKGGVEQTELVSITSSVCPPPP